MRIYWVGSMAVHGWNWQEHKMAVVYLLILKQANGFFLVGFYTAFYSSTWTISKRKNPGWDVFFFSPIERISALGLLFIIMICLYGY